jgi:ADP-heptose:LPS heptosyltransferase
VKKILFVGLRALGDMILVLPAIRAVRDTCSDAQIHVLVDQPLEKLFAEEPLIDRIVVLPRGNRRKNQKIQDFLRYSRFLLDLRKERYDLAIDLFTRGPRSRIIVFSSGATRRLGLRDHVHFPDRWVYTDQSRIPNSLNQLFDQESYLIGRLGFSPKNDFPELTLHPHNLEEARALMGALPTEGEKGFLAVFPGSGLPNKNWPARNFRDLMIRILQRGLRIVVLGGPLDADPFGQLKEFFPEPDPRICWIRQSDLTVLKGILALSRGAVGNDSGPLHMAQAVGKSVVVLFGPGDHISYRPYRGRMVHAGLACSPCQSFVKDCPDNQCMKAISVNQVEEALLQEGLLE